MKRLLVFLFASVGVLAQSPGPGSNHVNWTLEFSPATAAPGGKVLARLHAKIDPGWHLYSLSTPPPPIATTVQLAADSAFDLVQVYQAAPILKFDPNFNAKTETFEGETVFLLELAVKKDAAKGQVSLIAQPRYQTCSDTSCIPPKTKNVEALFNVDPSAKAASISIPSGYAEGKAKPAAGSPDDASLLTFIAIAFGFGLASIFTPCVFPMIPITMSFFLNQENPSRRQTVTQAGIFCLGIVVLFTGFGLITTALLGPFGVVQLGANPWVNGLICAIFLTFGLSLLGAFEITIPSFILTKLNTASQGGGVVGTLLMGLTFALASFACVGPFVGTLLAGSATSGGSRPAIGMLTFSVGLALPFFVLALFPSYLKKLPRSGGWLARVKVVMGFVIIAVMLKYLASIDQVLQWGFLTRERFLAAWIVLFLMPGLYLFGLLRMEGIKSDEPVGLGRLLTGMAFVIFSITLVPGMFGSKLGELDAYVPVASESVGGGAAGTEAVWLKNALPVALAKAKAEGKRVLVDFTGYACTNCHWMKANMFTKPEIASVLKSNYVLVDLYTDGTDEASQENQKLEESKFGTIAEPFYVIYDPEQNVIATFPQVTRDAVEYLAFLNTPAKAASAAPVIAAGSELDSLPITTLDGAPFDRSVLKGKVVVVDLWATWCVPCREEIPAFNKLNEQLKDAVIVGVSMDEEGAPIVRKFLKEHPMNYAVGLGAQSINDQLKIEQMPTTIIYDKSGKPSQRFEGLTGIEKIEAAIKEAGKLG
jgi:thiol:disulfide interchange protein DsbD